VTNPQPTFVMMAGLPGAGKTTLAYALGRAFQWQVIDKDSYKHVLLKQGLDDDSASNAAYELSFSMARNMLTKQQASVILDSSALHRFILDNVKDICGIANAQLKVILCVADRDLRNYRQRTRLYQPTNIRVDPATIADYLRHFKHLPPEPDTLILYTTASVEECLAKAKQHVKS
jgi:uridine kinase